MTIQSRKPAISQCKVFPLDYGEWTHYIVQGTDHDYHVYIPKKPEKYQVMTTGKNGREFTYYEYRPTCHSQASLYNLPPCKDNSNSTVCKHCLAAINDRFRRENKQASWPKDGEFSSAVKLLNFDSSSQLVKIRNQNGKSVWGVVR